MSAFGVEINPPSKDYNACRNFNRVCMGAISEFLRIKIEENHHNPQKRSKVFMSTVHLEV